MSGPAPAGDLALAHPSRIPAVPVAIALASGVFLDRITPLPFGWWLALAATSLVACAVSVGLRFTWAATLGILAAVLALGGARHHLVWSVRPANDIARLADDEPRFAVLTGTVTGSPAIRPRPEVSRTAWPDYDKTVFVLDVDAIKGDTGERTRVSGRVRVTITGHLPNLRAGDRVEFRGWMARPRSGSNPGEFDFSAWLRSRGITTVAWANHPVAVRRLGRGGTSLVRLADRIRRIVVDTVTRTVGDDVAPVANALLVGDRSRVPDETREAFAESGMLHLLAISGLHVGILAAFVWGLLRVVGTGTRIASALLLGTLLVYVVVVGARPSVVRASVFVAVVVLGSLWHRRVDAFQLLGIAAVGLLAWRPTDLFDTGAQLSFLAVAAIAFVASWRRSMEWQPSLVERGPIGEVLMRFGTALVASWIVMTAIWLFTAPLVAANFHLVSPAGLLLNVLLVPFVAVVMWCGYAFLVATTIVGSIADPLAWPFETGLSWVVAVSRWAGQWSLGHRYVAGPAVWWTAGFHMGLLAVLFTVRLPRWNVRVGCALLAWTVAGAVFAPRPEEGRLRCTFLAVGHGNAVFVEFPNGRSLLYDGGSLSSPEFVGRVIRGAVWSSSRSRIDAVVASHADVDHFNALPDVLDAVPVGSLFVSRTFLDFEQTFVPDLCERATARGTRIRLVHAGDRLALDDDVGVRVLHPADGASYESDNQASTVLSIEFAGRRILLTGDIEHAGLDDLLESQDDLSADVLAAPHHGSRAANTPGLATRVDPVHVVVSAGSRAPIEHLREVHPTANLHWTDRDGAVRITIESDGSLEAERGTGGRRD